jgi:tellurite resistance protein TerA
MEPVTKPSVITPAAGSIPVEQSEIVSGDKTPDGGQTWKGDFIMAEIKAKVVLKKKGEEAFIPIKQIMVQLKWTQDVDLDLMAFYKTKDGRVGGIFSDQYPGGSMGSMNAFPFIQLDQDAGVGGVGGENEENIRITKLDDMAEVYLCTLNYTDASQNKESSFANYDGHVVVMDDRGSSVAVPLDSPEKGHVAVVAKIDSTNPIGAKLINLNNILTLNDFVNQIPGANLLVN